MHSQERNIKPKSPNWDSNRKHAEIDTLCKTSIN